MDFFCDLDSQIVKLPALAPPGHGAPQPPRAAFVTSQEDVRIATARNSANTAQPPSCWRPTEGSTLRTQSPSECDQLCAREIWRPRMNRESQLPRRPSNSKLCLSPAALFLRIGIFQPESSRAPIPPPWIVMLGRARPRSSWFLTPLEKRIQSKRPASVDRSRCWACSQRGTG